MTEHRRFVEHESGAQMQVCPPLESEVKTCPVCHVPGVPLPINKVDKIECQTDDCDVDTYL